MKFLKLAGLVVLTLVACAYAAYLGRHEIARMNEELPQFTAAAGETQEERIVMQDGVKLFATVMLPKGEGPFPAILAETPMLNSPQSYEIAFVAALSVTVMPACCRMFEGRANRKVSGARW